ncbi:hypothetical protein PILCRDRAFT_12650 [Piloderma croceum F 1598]|uniref:Uncharacterized protein n=1 Tax=Piloderma croceum (strain F 1598) TaxID=765440 RepID=A0A0C3F9R2_PILCF|nr:hypothetical protein PILCRDRAFT_12650 [Piloderma croceum F 1598]
MVAASLIPGWFFEVLDILNEIDDQAVKSRVRCSASIFTRYHDAKDLPANFIAIGDSIMKLNPIFGHGCTQAVLGVAALDSTLRKACCTEVGSKAPPFLPANFSRDFFAAQRTKIEPIWDTTKIVDYGLPTTVPIPGESLSSGALIRWYQRRFQLLVFTDKDACSAIWHVRSFLAPQIDTIQPSLVLKVLWIAITHPNL